MSDKNKSDIPEEKESAAAKESLKKEALESENGIGEALQEEVEKVAEKKPETPKKEAESQELASALVEEAGAQKKEKASEEEAAQSSEKEVTETPSEEKEEKSATEKVSEKPEGEEEDHAQEDEEEISSSDEEEDDENDDSEAQTDYHSLTKKELVAEFEKLLKSKPVQEIKNQAEEIKTEFNAKFNEELEQKKEAFLEEGGNIIDFQYTTPLKKEFNSLYFDYKEKRNNYYKSLKKDLQENLNKRLELIEELKGLLNAEENINTTYKHFKDIQDRWHVAGAIPRDKYNIVWNTYHHHVENFYDFLHLNREFRDLDFKHNLEQKLKLIGRADELAQEKDVNKAFRELQMLHKMWKEDIGPVAKEYREEVWDKFSAATKVIHDRRQEQLAEMEKEFVVNYEKKKELVEEIASITANTKPNHQSWQNAMKKVQALRDAYFALGKVPRANNKEIWSMFKDATRSFNHEKNSFYKNQKKEQYKNLEKKLELIKIAEEHKDSDDFNEVTPLMKKIQSDWKKIGHVPRKDSDKIWKQFKGACNHYFDRLHAQKNQASKEEKENLEIKQQQLDTLSKFELSDDPKEDLTKIKQAISAWKKVGRVPYNKKDIDQKFNTTLDGLFKKLDLSKKEADLIKFENKLNSMVSQEDERKLQNEQFFITKKISETKDEIRQLENNLGFFQDAKSDNPLVKEVRKNIAKHKEQLEVWKEKLSKIKSLR
ncbi:MAG: chromosome segregation protein [Altibacter sp.]|nr:chromosome segregation protein [Altibacter sp.]